MSLVGSLRLPRSWRALLVLGVLTIWVLVAMGQLQSLLAATHLPGAPSYTVQDLDRFFHLGPDTAHTRDVVAVWEAGAREVATAGSDVAGPHEILGILLLVDTLLLVPLYVLLLSLLFRLAEARLAASGGGGGVLGSVARTGGILVLAGGALDVVENVSFWRVSETGSDLGAFAWVLWLASLGKWVLVGAAVVLALLLGWVVAAHAVSGRRPSELLHPVRTVGPIVVLVALFALAVPLQEQLADLIRRWQAPQLVLAVFVTSGFALTAWVVARRLLLVGRWRPAWAPGAEARWGRRLFLALLVVAIAQLVPHAVLSGRAVDPGWGLTVPAVLVGLLVLLGFPLRTVAAVPREEAPRTGAMATSDRVARGLAAVVVVALGIAVERASVGYLVYWREWSATGAVVLAAAIVGALVFPRLQALPPLSKGHRLGRLVTEPATGALTGALLAAIAIGPWSGGDVNPTVLAALSLVLVAAGLRLPVALRSEPTPVQRLDVRWLGFVVLFLVAVGTALAIDPWEAGQLLGGIGVVAAFFTLLAMVVGLVSWIGPAIPVPRALRTLGLREFPLVTLLLLWFVVASQLDRSGAFHDVRVVHRAEAGARTTLQQRFDCWLGRRGLEQDVVVDGADCSPTGVAPADGVQPLVVVASTGGGIRSAYWTAFALDCAFGTTEKPAAGDRCATRRRGAPYARSDALFAASGISGGSLGIAEYAAHLASGAADTGGWIRRRLDVDGLSPAAGWWLFAEIPRVFLQFDVPRDRASVLEQAWEREWPDHSLEQGVIATTSRAHVPLLLLNSTNVDDGCRISVSALDANIDRAVPEPQPVGCRSNALFDEAPGTTPDVGAPTGLVDGSVLPATYDLADYLCDGGDVRLSTGALLSARFPYVNPSGRITPDDGCGADLPPTLHAVDGGYLDTSGASTLVELTTVLAPLVEGWNRAHAAEGRCIVPFAVQIDNGFESTAAPTPTRPKQLLVPPATLSASRIGRAAEAKAALAFLYSRPWPGVEVDGEAGARPLADRYAHFVNEAHPGPGAPLGWAQSRLSQRELERQQAAGKNRSALAEVDTWFSSAASGTLRCAPTP